MQATTAPESPVQTTTKTEIITLPAQAAGTMVPGVPRTAQDLAALKSRREELSNQLTSAAGRRAGLSRQLIGKDGVDRAGIESHISVLDKRIMQLESDIAETGRQLTLTPGYLVASTRAENQFMGMDPDAVAALSAVFIIFVLAPMAFAMARRIWKRSNYNPAPTAISTDTTRRLERLEQGVDAIAVEIERVSEGQRFVTRLLSEGRDMSPIPVANRVGDGTSGGAGQKSSHVRT